MTKYIRIVGEHSTLVLSVKQFNQGLDQENHGVEGSIYDEKTTDLDHLFFPDKKKGCKCDYCKEDKK